MTATVTSTDAGNFALDLDNLGTQVIASVAGWYAYDSDSVFTDRDGGTYTITLGAAAANVSHIIDVGDRNELVSLTGNGTNLSFQIVGEGKVVVDLANSATAVVTGATVVSQAGEILTLNLGPIGTHDVAVTLPAPSAAPVITSNGGGATAAISYAENGIAAVTTVTATDPDVGQTLSYAIGGGADAGLFNINATTGALTFITSPDFETPRDAGLNNIYDVIVKVTDSGATPASDTQALAVTVSNVNGTTFNGTAAANVANGTPEADTMNGADGNDTLSGLAGNDALTGGAGNDTLNGGAGNDNLNGNAGLDVLDGGDGNDILNGAADNDTVTGGAGNDQITGAAGIDLLTGGAQRRHLRVCHGCSIRDGHDPRPHYRFCIRRGQDRYQRVRRQHCGGRRPEFHIPDDCGRSHHGRRPAALPPRYGKQPHRRRRQYECEHHKYGIPSCLEWDPQPFRIRFHPLRRVKDL